MKLLINHFGKIFLYCMTIFFSMGMSAPNERMSIFKFTDSSGHPIKTGTIVLIRYSEEFVFELCKNEKFRQLHINNDGIAKIKYRTLVNEFSEGHDTFSAYFWNKKRKVSFRYLIERDTNFIRID